MHWRIWNMHWRIWRSFCIYLTIVSLTLLFTCTLWNISINVIFRLATSILGWIQWLWFQISCNCNVLPPSASLPRPPRPPACSTASSFFTYLPLHPLCLTPIPRCSHSSYSPPSCSSCLLLFLPALCHIRPCSHYSDMLFGRLRIGWNNGCTFLIITEFIY